MASRSAKVASPPSSSPPEPSSAFRTTPFRKPLNARVAGACRRGLTRPNSDVREGVPKIVRSAPTGGGGHFHHEAVHRTGGQSRGASSGQDGDRAFFPVTNQFGHLNQVGKSGFIVSPGTDVRCIPLQHSMTYMTELIVEQCVLSAGVPRQLTDSGRGDAL